MRMLLSCALVSCWSAACSSDPSITSDASMSDSGVSDSTSPFDARSDGAVASDAAQGTAAESAYVTIASSSDFIPCRGLTLPGPSNAMGPWRTRLVLARSTDGLAFTRTGKILADQSDVPDAITLSTGEIRVYYIAACPESVANKIVFASSTNMTEWTFRSVNVTGTTDLGPQPVDPTVERTDDGKYRLYFTSAPKTGGNARTYSALSDDGVTFALESGSRFMSDTGNVLDPTVLKIANTWHYFAGGMPGAPGTQKNYHATSADGLTFTRQTDFSSEGVLMANGLAVSGGYRYYGFVQSPGTASIRSLFTSDGASWKLEDGFRLDVDSSSAIEQDGVKDPGVTKATDGTYWMIYSTMMKGVDRPDGGTPPPPDGGMPPPQDGGK